MLGVWPVKSDGLETASFQAVQDSLGISPDLARVIDAYRSSAPTSPEFILIQDVHGHPQVQSRIASIILQGYDRWGVRKVFVEGAFTPLDFSIFHRVPKKTQSLLMERLVKDGDLSGPELAAVLIMEREWRNPPVSPFQLLGMEDPKLYRQNVQAYQLVLAKRERALEEVVSIRRLQLSMNVPDHNPLAEQLDRVEDLLRLKMTPAEFGAYLNAKASAPSSPALNQAVRAAEDFYRVAQRRSRVFLMEASRKVPASVSVRMLVVGGFHTVEMADLLRRENRSFIVLSPLVDTSASQPNYEKHLQQTAIALTEAIPQTR